MIQDLSSVNVSEISLDYLIQQYWLHISLSIPVMLCIHLALFLEWMKMDNHILGGMNIRIKIHFNLFVKLKGKIWEE